MEPRRSARSAPRTACSLAFNCAACKSERLSRSFRDRRLDRHYRARRVPAANRQSPSEDVVASASGEATEIRSALAVAVSAANRMRLGRSVPSGAGAAIPPSRRHRSKSVSARQADLAANAWPRAAVNSAVRLRLPRLGRGERTRGAAPMRRLVAANAASSSWRRRRTVVTMSFTALGCARWGWSVLPHTGQAVSGASMLRRCTASGETASSARSARVRFPRELSRSRSWSDSASAISALAALTSCTATASSDSPRARSADARICCSQAVLASRSSLQGPR